MGGGGESRVLNSGQDCFGSILKRSSLKGKNLLPVGANSFLLEKISFQKACFQKTSFQKGLVCSKVNRSTSVCQVCQVW